MENKLSENLQKKLCEFTKSAESKIKELKKSKKTSDIEKANKLKGSLETYKAMNGILNHGYSVTKVIELLDNTRNQLRTELYAKLSNHYIGMGRKSPETWEEIQVICGKLDGLSNVREIIDNAFL